MKTSFEHHPLCEAIVAKALELQLAGATVLCGPMGFGRSSRLRTTKILSLSEDLPVVIEIVDTRGKIDEFLPVIDAMVASGMMTFENVRIHQPDKRGIVTDRG